jgi:hypothetical protein
VKTFQRNDRDEEEKPTSVVFDGNNGAEVTEWSRDGDLSARFMHRPELPDERDREARVLLAKPHIHWEVVPVGSTISLDREGNLVLTLPQPDEPAEEDTEA